jgi:hypothetical protein
MSIETIHNLSATDYRAREEISNSDLSQFARSPLHYLYSRENPTPSTPAQQLGTAVHTLVLEEEDFPVIYREIPEGINLRTKAGKEERDSLLKEVGSPEYLLKPETAKVVRDIAEAVWAHPAARQLLEGAVTEVSRFWEEPFGLKCKCRVDALPIGGWSDFVVDLKTTVNAEPKDFVRSLHRWGYHRQAAFYLKSFPLTSVHIDLDSEFADALHYIDGRTSFAFIAVESSPPHAVSVMELDSKSLAQGLAEVNQLIDDFTTCQVEDIYPGYSDEIETISLPPYALKKTVMAKAP